MFAELGREPGEWIVGPVTPIRRAWGDARKTVTSESRFVVLSELIAVGDMRVSKGWCYLGDSWWCTFSYKYVQRSIGRQIGVCWKTSKGRSHAPRK